MDQRLIQIHWNGFIKQCCEKYPEECCAFLFANKPFSKTEEWFVFPVDNIIEDKTQRWKPDWKQLQKIKREAKEKKLTKIGNIHSHPLPKTAKPIDNNIEYMRHPSPLDLRYARKHNDTIRGILVVNKTAVLGFLFHDQFGEPVDLYLNGLD